MKKLMFIAAFAAVTGVYAGSCSPDPEPTPERDSAPIVYDWKFSGKTAYGVVSKSKSIDSGTCGPEVVTTNLVMRQPANFLMDGWSAICECGQVGGPVEGWDGYAFWITKPYKSYFGEDGAVDMKAHDGESFTHVIGAKKTQAEIFSGFTGTSTYVNTGYGQTWDFDYAGLGTYKSTNPFTTVGNYCGFYPKFSGSFAGYATAPYFIKPSVDICDPSVVFDCADCTANEIEDQPTVVYGNWSVKYNSSVSSKYYKSRAAVATKITPSWADFVISK